MRRFFFPIFFLLLIGVSEAQAGSDNRADVAAAKQNLQEQRATYKKSVAEQGVRSPGTEQARANLRSARRAYHARRRQLESSRHGR